MEKSKELINRYEKLLESYIIKFNITNNYENKNVFYNDFMSKLVFGELDDSLSFPSLKKIENNDRKDLHDLVHKYSSLCFYQGDYRNWSDSIEGVTSRDLEFIFIKVLDNYSFLYDLAIIGGEKVLQGLKDMEKLFLNKSSVIDYLRNSFEKEDEVLKTVLLEMTRDNGLFSDYSQEEKAILLVNPKGTLYLEEDKVLSPTTKDYLSSLLLARGYDNNHNISFFKEIIQDISYEYSISNDN